VTAYPGLTGRRLLRELRERGYEGGYTAVTDALRELRPARLPAFEVRGLVCAVKRRRFPVGAKPTRQPLQLEATGAVMEVTKWLKPSDSVSRKTVTARVCRP
jgi:transposase